MSVFTTTTKRKVIGLIMALVATVALAATIVFALAGESHHALSAASMFVSIISIMFSTATRMKKKDAEVKAAERRRNYWSDIAI